MYEQLRRNDIVCFHLSAAMCQAHRKAVIARMEAALEDSRRGGPKVLCVSTQVIEAGVDVSFGSVIRLLAGMDNAVQTAGRCNRNGESEEPALVYLITCSDESLSVLREIQDAKPPHYSCSPPFAGTRRHLPTIWLPTPPSPVTTKICTTA